MRIGFIGIGKLGKPCAEVIAKNGHIVEAYDILPAESEHFCVVNSIEKVVNNKDIVFVAVPTPHNPDYDGREPTSHLPAKDFCYDTVIEVLTEANKYMSNDQLLVLISTVLPGTTRKHFVNLISNTRFVYNPYLIAMGTVEWDMVNPEMIMIGTEDGTETGDAKQLIDFYKTIMENNPRYVIGTWDECECIKVFYNTFISTKIGLVNMIQDVAERQGNINVDVVTKALAESTQRITSSAYMKAGMGDGGACHPRDNIALRYLAENLELGYDLFGSIIAAREQQAKNMAIKLLTYGKRIQFSSNSYKHSVDLTDGSYSLLVQHFVKQLGGTIVTENPEVYFKVHESDNVPEGTLIFDPWRSESSPNTVHYGNTRFVG